jgi:hypothetical protein
MRRDFQCRWRGIEEFGDLETKYFEKNNGKQRRNKFFSV